MATFDTRVTVGIYCTCGTPLIQEGAGGMGHLTVKPCPACTQVKRIDERMEEKKYNRRGVEVSERST